MLADRLGIYFDEEINNRLRGVSRMESLEIILEKSDKKYTDEEKYLYTEEKNDNYKELLMQMSANDLSDEVKNTLYELKKCGKMLAIGSSSKNAKMILDKIGLGEFFDAISDGTNISNSKPDPEVFIKAAEFLSLKPENCLVVEDAIAGIEAATRGGFDSAGLGEANLHNDVTYRLSSFSDLLTVVK